MAIQFQTCFADSQSPGIQFDLPALDVVDFCTKGTASADLLKRVKVRCGKSTIDLGDLFQVQVMGSSHRFVFQGQTDRLNGIGVGLKGGEIRVEGSVGERCGHRMSGGRIEILGSAGNNLAAENRGGRIVVHQNVGAMAAAALTARQRGGNGGELFIGGDLGPGAAARMRRGLIVVGGNLLGPAAQQMLSGTVIVCGKVPRHFGDHMKRGTLVCRHFPMGLTGFTECNGSAEPSGPAPETTNPQVWRLMHRYLSKLDLGFSLPNLPGIDQKFRCFHGPQEFQGRGELFLAADP